MYKKAFKTLGLISICMLLAAFSTGAVFADSLPQPAQAAFDQKVVARVDAERALEHIAYLSETIGPHPGGMDAEWEGAGYIASVLESYGYEVELQPFPVSDQYIGTIELAAGEQWQLGAARRGVITGDDFIPGELIFVYPGTDPGDFPTETAGKIVLMERASSTSLYRTQVANAEAAGASAVILYSLVGSRGNYGGAWNPRLSSSSPADIPVLGSAWIQGMWLLDMLDQGPVFLSVQTKHYADLESVNVIGIKPAKSGDPDADAILVTGHLDSVVGAPGANDNSSGVALALELARVFRGYNTDKELRFILFGSEERGLRGSRYYVNQLSDEEQDQIMAVFNGDMVATSYPVVTHLYAMTVDGELNLVTEAAEAAGSRLGNSSILPGEFGSSDHVPFHQVGIPAALFIWMRIDSWDPLVYYIEKVYHTPQDTIAENISLERMQNALDIVGAAVFDVVRKEVPALENSRVRAVP
jgi:aminopeptidase YwaD